MKIRYKVSVTFTEETRNTSEIWMGNLRIRDRKRKPGVYGRNILKRILKEKNVRVRND
jgi:hypothetical protein